MSSSKRPIIRPNKSIESNGDTKKDSKITLKAFSTKSRLESVIDARRRRPENSAAVSRTHKRHHEILSHSNETRGVYWKRNNNKNRIKEMSINLLKQSPMCRFPLELSILSNNSPIFLAHSPFRRRKFSILFELAIFIIIIEFLSPFRGAKIPNVPSVAEH